MRRDVDVAAAGDALVVDGERVAADDLSGIDHDHARVFGRDGHPGWRLGFDSPPPADIAAILPARQKFGRWIDRHGLWRAAVVATVVSAVLVVGVLSAPRWIAPLIPMSVERRLGDTLIGDIDSHSCSGKGGQAALDALAARIEPGRADLRVRAVPVPMVNAITLPGGTILIFDGLLKQAAGPDELAGVLGHEIGHVRHRDTLKGLLREAGLTILTGGANGALANNAGMVVALRYSRDAEGDADDYAIDALRRAHVSPVQTAGFFQRLAKQGDASGALAWLSSHPVSADRRARFLNSRGTGPVTPALDATQWRALSTMCAGDRQAEWWRPF
ncbi:Peptidase M48 domain-containing protein [Sphingomonas antarctica]